MILQFTNNLAVHGVPDLRGAVRAADRQMLALVAPGDTRYLVVSWVLAQPLDLRGARAPHVDCAVERYSQHVLAAPVDQVQVEVVLQLWRVQHLVRHLIDATGLCDGCLAWLRRAVEGTLALVPVTGGHTAVDAHAHLDRVRCTSQEFSHRLRALVVFVRVKLEDPVS